jgi:hypothetical protein
MDTSHFDALVRALVIPGPRRAVLAAGGAFTALLTRFSPDVAAGCKMVGAKCKKNGNCCAGARCRHGRCRCKKGRTVCGDNGDCCAECFKEATAPKPKGISIPDTEACCAATSVCKTDPGDPQYDLCCWPNETCINGDCCCVGCEGTVICGGKCCPSVSCCNGACCGAGQVCARTQPNGPLTCVSADRSCNTDDQCFQDEECRGGTCCSGDRLCFEYGQNTDPVCCALGKYCDPGSKTCCANGDNCNTGKKVRIRA